MTTNNINNFNQDFSQSGSKVTYTTYQKKNKKGKKTKLGFSGYRLSMKVTGFVSSIGGAILPFVFYSIIAAQEGTIATLWVYLYLFLVFYSIVNFISGSMLIYDAYKRTDIALVMRKNYYLYSAPLLMLGGAFIIAIMHILLWRVTRKNKHIVSDVQKGVT